MNQFMTEDVIGFLERSGEWKHNAPLEHLSDTACRFAWCTADSVRLLEMRVTGVVDDDLPASEPVIQQARKA
jgi:hypothetical protein